MLYFFQAGGPYMWLLLAIGIVILVLAITTGIRLFGATSRQKPQLEQSTNSILFWGGFSVILGFFAHFYGIYQAMQAIQAAADISPAIVAGGYAVSIITILTGLFIFMVAALIWFIYRARLAKLQD